MTKKTVKTSKKKTTTKTAKTVQVASVGNGSGQIKPNGDG